MTLKAAMCYDRNAVQPFGNNIRLGENLVGIANRLCGSFLIN